MIIKPDWKTIRHVRDTSGDGSVEKFLKLLEDGALVHPKIGALKLHHFYKVIPSEVELEVPTGS